MAGSRPLSSALVPVPENTQYSTLEVDSNRWLENDSNAAPIPVQDPKSEKIVSYNGAALIVGQDPKNEKIIIHSDAGKLAVAASLYITQAEPSPPTKDRKILGLKRKTFFTLSIMVLVLIIAGAIGGGVGGAIAARNRNKNAAPTATTAIQVGCANTGLAAMLWTDLNGTLHKRLYYQDNKDMIRESAWENNTSFNTAWHIYAISDVARPCTPIAAVAGYPHASYNYSVVFIAHCSLSTTC